MTTKPDGKMPEMNQTRHESKAREGTVDREVASAVNLMAHPMAGMAAAGAFGFGVASQMVGLWFGAVAGAAEASHRMLSGGRSGLPADPHPAKPAARRTTLLELVAATPAGAEAAAHTLLADVESAMRDVVEVAGETGEAAIADAAAVLAAAVKPAGMKRPAAPDDLKAISGIGPKLEKVLNGLGVWTYGQIGALTGPEIAWLDDHLGFSGRIGRDDWIGQARRLADGA